MNTKQFLCFIKVLCFSSAISAQTYTLTFPPNGNNQKSSISQQIGLVTATIVYHGPDVHSPEGEDRKGHIWGELVPYGLTDPGYGTSMYAPWRTGSNEITSINFTHDVLINGKELKAGTYGLMLIVEKDKPWTWIFSKNFRSWGVYYYNQDEDVLRVNATPKQCEYSEWLTFGFDNRQLLRSEVFLHWENMKISFDIEVPNGLQLYVDQMGYELTSYAGFTASNWLKCARFCLDYNVGLEEALKWINISMNTERFGFEKIYEAFRIKAEILFALKRDEEAFKILDESLALNPTMLELHSHGRLLLLKGKSAKALEIFKLNRRNNPDDKFTTFVGLARGYTATDNKKEAVKNWEIALKNIPENQKYNELEFLEELNKLKN